MAETKQELVIRCVEKLIRDGGLVEGDLLPTWEELQRICDASEATIARAMLILKERGIVRPERGRRVFVGPRRPTEDH